MPFYIDSISKASAWNKHQEELTGKELTNIKEISSYGNNPAGFCEGNIVKCEFIGTCVIAIAGVTIRWEDYPSEECRAGLLDSPSVAPDDSNSNLILPSHRKRYKEPKALDI